MKEISKIMVYTCLDAPEKWDSFYAHKDRFLQLHIGEHNELYIHKGDYIITTDSNGTWKKIVVEYSYLE